jgi:hypothetical protein
VDLGAPGRETQRGQDDTGEDFFARGVRDSGKKMEEGDGKVGTQSSRGRSGGTKESPVAAPVRQAKQNGGDENKEYERAGTRRAAKVTELRKNGG